MRPRSRQSSAESAAREPGQVGPAALSARSWPGPTPSTSAATPTRRDEIAGVGDAAAGAFGTLTTRIEDLHGAIATRAFAGSPAKLVHDNIATGVYASVRTIGGLVARAGATAWGLSTAPDAPPLTDNPRTRIAVGAINGAFGDAMERRANGLAQPLALIGEPTGPRVAVFIHGLCGTEDAWGWGGRTTYGALLQEELGYTPVFVRVNTGRRISANGRDLAAALEATVGPDVESLVLIGHSMGALIARSACHQGLDMDWTRRVRYLVSLGAPNLGAPLERGANAAGWALNLLPETRPIASLLNARSAGIKDLRYGSLLEDDWLEHDPDELLHCRCTEVPLLEGATHCYIGATLTADREALLGRLVGDLLVTWISASGQGSGSRRIPFQIDDGRHVGGIHHMALLNHPLVYEQIRDWLSRTPGRARRALPAARG